MKPNEPCSPAAVATTVMSHTNTSVHTSPMDVGRGTCPHRLKASFVHELNRRTEKVCQGAQFLVHCTVTQLLFLTNYNKNVPSCQRK